MAENSKIEWTHHTANLWWGCTKVHEGCDNCYAEAASKHRGKSVWGNDNPRALVMSVWADLAKYQKTAQTLGTVHKVFVGSMMDIFEKPMPVNDWNGKPQTFDTDVIRQRFFKEISEGKYPNLLFLLLTKRPSNINKYIPESWKETPPENVMFGTSPANQATAFTLVEQLVKVNGKRFLSVEPQLGELSLIPWLSKGDIHWVIQGGESGHHKRPFDTDWGRKLKAECEQYNVPFFFKQIDKVQAIPDDLMVRENPHFYQQILKSKNMKENNEDLNKGKSAEQHKSYYYQRHGYIIDNVCFFNGNVQNIDDLDYVTLLGQSYPVMESYNGFSSIWPLKSYLPFLKNEVYKKLLHSIKEGGLMEPVVYLTTPEGQKVVVDGHNSLIAAMELNMTELATQEITEVFTSLDEIKLWIIKRQFQRTNLSNQQKVRLAYQAKETIQALANKNREKAANGESIETHIVTCEEIARLAGVGKSTVTRFESIMKSGKQEIIRQLENDEVTIGFAYSFIEANKKVKESKAKQVFSIDHGNNLLNIGEIETFMIVTDRKQIDLLPQSKQAKVGFYIMEKVEPTSLPIENDQKLEYAA